MRFQHRIAGRGLDIAHVVYDADGCRGRGERVDLGALCSVVPRNALTPAFTARAASFAAFTAFTAFTPLATGRPFLAHFARAAIEACLHRRGDAVARRARLGLAAVPAALAVATTSFTRFTTLARFTPFRARGALATFPVTPAGFAFTAA